VTNGPNISNNALNAARKQRVQSNAFAAAIPAALLLFFGFTSVPWTDEPSVLLFSWTLKIGGVAFAIIAAASLTGIWHVLIVDAIVSIVCGVVFGLTAALWTAQGSIALQTLLNGVFCLIFIGAGMRTWRDYWGFPIGTPKPFPVRVPPAESNVEPPRNPGPAATATMEALKRAKGGDTPFPSEKPVKEVTSMTPIEPVPQTVIAPPAPEPIPAKPPPRKTPAEPPPSGFLAAFADEDDD
jgi:hypothetical protein